MRTREKWQGMLTIVRFNWPFYGAAIFVGLAMVLVFTNSDSLLLRWACGLVLVGVLHFLVISLWVSHLVYDRSDLYRWKWLARALAGAETQNMVFCHSGFDESSQDLCERFPQSKWVILDHYDEHLMSEASIKRARKCFPPSPKTLRAAYDCWPLANAEVDIVFGLLAIHELRSEKERTAWFIEAQRCLKSGGRIILVEHTRDLANFLAFGPGFLHFHSNRSWENCWARADFQVIETFQITHWIRVFLLSKP